MTITIGRFGTDITVGNPMQFTRSGQNVSVSGWVAAPSQAAMNALIQQLNGLEGPDEPVVPLTYSYDSTWNGYYRVNGVAHQVDPAWEKTFRFQYKIDLVRFAAYPVVEMIIMGAARTGNPGLTPINWHSVPSTWNGYDYTNLVAFPSGTRALSSTVNMNVYEDSLFLNTTATAGSTPAELYTGAATLKTGSTLYTVQGRDITNTPSNWELSNGLVKVGSTTGASNHWTVAVRNAAGTAWSAAYGIQLGYFSIGAGAFVPLPFGVTPRSVTVLRNSPEEVLIRLAYEPDTANTTAVSVDLGMIRGARHCTVTLRTHNVQRWGMGFSTPVACSNVSFYAVSIRETSANADGNRNFMGITSATPTRDLTNGTITMAAGGSAMDGFFGSEVGGAGAATVDTSNIIEQMYYSAQAEKQRIVPQ